METQVGAGVLELAALTTTFWDKDGPQYRKDSPKMDQNDKGRMKEALMSRVTWLCSAFFFTYMAVESMSALNPLSLSSLC